MNLTSDVERRLAELEQNIRSLINLIATSTDAWGDEINRNSICACLIEYETLVTIYDVPKEYVERVRKITRNYSHTSSTT